MAKVLLIRHGTTKLNGDVQSGEDRIRGWVDVPLDKKGLKDAEKVRDELHSRYDIDCIYSSDLSRALETAKICNQDALPITVMQELRPWNLGIFQGRATKSILEEMNSMIRNDEVAVKDGESFKEFRERFLGALMQIIHDAIEEDEQAAIFTHFRDLKAADAWAKKGYPLDLTLDVNTMIKDDFKPGTILDLPIEPFMDMEKAERDEYGEEE